MGQGHSGIGKGRHQRADLLQVLRRFENPTVGPPHPLQGLKNLLHVRIVWRLVVGEIIVTPARRTGDPLKQIA